LTNGAKKKDRNVDFTNYGTKIKTDNYLGDQKSNYHLELT